MIFKYYNDTKRIVGIHPATLIHGCKCDNSPIKHGEERVFELPEGTFPWVKMWDYGNSGLSILVSPQEITVQNKEKDSKMDHKEVWGDTKKWLDNSIQYLEEQLYKDSSVKNAYSNTKEKERIKNKLDGLKTVRQHMSESEKIYEL